MKYKVNVLSTIVPQPDQVNNLRTTGPLVRNKYNIYSCRYMTFVSRALEEKQLLGRKHDVHIIYTYFQ